MITCGDAYKNLNVVNKQGQLEISPCCFTQPKPVDFIDFNNDSYLTSVRKAFDQGQFFSSCVCCKNSEKAGLVSRRLGSNQWYHDNDLHNTKVELVRLDYWVGDTCNLACAICGPKDSSTWKQELKIPIRNTKSNVNKFWKLIDTSQLQFVHFNGGEPLLSKEHEIFLQSLSNKQQIHINYNTNATVLASDSLLELWSKFKLVQIDFSIDDIEQRFEYQRYPARWHNVVNNLQWFRNTAPHNCMFGINTTISALNTYNLSELEHWLDNNFHHSRFEDPVQHNKQFAMGILSLDNIKKTPQSIIQYLNNIDQRRKTNWRELFPNLVDDLEHNFNPDITVKI